MKKWIRAAGILLITFALAGCGSGAGAGMPQGDSGGEPVGTCTISIECSVILENRSELKAGKEEFVPEDGVILKETEVSMYEGSTVFDLLRDVCRREDIHMESSFTPLYNSYYIEGIHNLYEFDCGENSGWMYCVNGEYPNYGCSSYEVEDGDVIEWHYTCELGSDIGGESDAGE